MIIAIRHLPTEMNAQHRIQGRLDTDILPIENDSARLINSNVHFIKKHYDSERDIVLCSNLTRTKSTAKAYGFYEYKVDELLNELDFGMFEGGLKSDIVLEFGDKWIDRPSDIVMGESIKDLSCRVTHLVDSYSHYRNIIIFGHGAWIRAMNAIYNHGNLDAMNKTPIENNTMITVNI